MQTSLRRLRALHLMQKQLEDCPAGRLNHVERGKLLNITDMFDTEI